MEAIQHCEYFICYVSVRCIGSLWVQKEVEAALTLDSGAKPYVFIDGEDIELLNLLENWKDTGPPNPSLIREFCQKSANSVGKTSKSPWPYRCETFIEELDEYLYRTEGVVVAFPSPKNKDLWKGKALKLKNWSEFLEGIQEATY